MEEYDQHFDGLDTTSQWPRVTQKEWDNLDKINKKLDEMRKEQGIIAKDFGLDV